MTLSNCKVKWNINCLTFFQLLVAGPEYMTFEDLSILEAGYSGLKLLVKGVLGNGCFEDAEKSCKTSKNLSKIL